MKSIPIATGSQFLLYPSVSAAMGGVSIAVDDPWGDPFVNPAKGSGISSSIFTATPQFYSIGRSTSGLGHSAYTLPVTVLGRYRQYFGGIGLAWQEMTRQEQNDCCWVFSESLTSSFATLLDVAPQGGISRRNLYLTLFGGKELSKGLSVGFSVFAAGLAGVEGVQLLYGQGDDVDQEGGMATYKVGLSQRWESGRTAEVILQHNRFKMSHTITSVFWDGDWDDGQWRSEQRLEKDETNGVALRLGYSQPLSKGWTIGARLVGDWKSHPKIPNYDLMQIPRDPGNTGAYNIGVGFSRVIRKTTFAFDMIYEPIWSHTWAYAEEDIVFDDLPPIKAGEKTVENFFRFNNSRFRIGVQQKGSRMEFGMGLNLHAISYRLEQENFVGRFERTLDESWGEWTLTASLGYDFKGFLLKYLSILTWGTGQPGILNRGFSEAGDGLLNNSSFVAAPAGALGLIDARVWTHRLTLVVPLTE